VAIILVGWNLYMYFSVRAMLKGSEEKVLIEKNTCTLLVCIPILLIILVLCVLPWSKIRDDPKSFFIVIFISQGLQILFCFMMCFAFKSNTDGKPYPPYLYWFYELFGYSEDDFSYQKLEN